MASPVSYNGDDLKVLIAELYMECRIRAQREDALLRRIAALEAALAGPVSLEEP